jgi:hypothetical protein
VAPLAQFWPDIEARLRSNLAEGGTPPAVIATVMTRAEEHWRTVAAAASAKPSANGNMMALAAAFRLLIDEMVRYEALLQLKPGEVVVAAGALHGKPARIQ